MIPKIFHRVWIGSENKESDLFWQNNKSIHKDWEHVTYKEPLPSGFNIIKDVVFFSDNAAYQSDLIRLEALYKFGGFYVDADIEVYKSFNDFTNLENPIVGWENKDNNSIGSAVIGSPAKNKYILEPIMTFANVEKPDEANKLLRSCFPLMHQFIYRHISKQQNTNVIENKFDEQSVITKVFLKYSEMSLVSFIYKHSEVLEQKDSEIGSEFTLKIKPKDINIFESKLGKINK
jgi:mannosyltransferase OCH1-like enzyme